ncbi:MAG: glycosyltransferase family 2 protein [Paludibacteraceae bacterium]|nr:glycosyltransferase family 2 protein [Paludibacteraceae bacterium]
MKCSIIILNWNGAEMLRRYLPSVVEHTTLPDCEIVVADNGSTDNSLEVLRTVFPSVRTLVLDRNYGFAEGYNRALAETESTYTVLLNSDVEVTEGWLEPLLAFMDTHPDVAAVQPKIRSWLHRDRFEHAGAAGGFINALGYPYCHGRVLWHVEQDKGQYDTPAEVAWTSGACMCVRTAVYKDCGGLDAAFFAHMEEIDLCWRMRNRGWRLVCLPQSVVYHLGGGALNYESPRKTYLNHRNNLLMIYKNKQHPWGVLFIRFFLDYAAALFYLLQGRPQACKAVFTARRDYRRMRKTY